MSGHDIGQLLQAAGDGSVAESQHQFSNNSLVLHEAIIDLYLQVKVRSNDEVSNQICFKCFID